MQGFLPPRFGARSHFYCCSFVVLAHAVLGLAAAVVAVVVVVIVVAATAEEEDDDDDITVLFHSAGVPFLSLFIALFIYLI